MRRLIAPGIPGAASGACPPAPGIVGLATATFPRPRPVADGAPASRDDMTPESKLKEGRPDEALQLLTAEVRTNPADAKRRVFLFQLLALLGQWERAQNQLNVCG